MNNSAFTQEPTVRALLTGLMHDAQKLLWQEVALETHEVQVEIRNTLRAVMSLGLGIGIAAIDRWLWIPMVVHLCHARAALPLWACDGIMGGLCAVGGIGLLVPGKQQLARMPLVPQATVETMKENMQWIKDQARTNGPSWSTTGNWPRRQMSRFMWPLGVGKAIISMPILTLEPSSRFRGSVSGNTTTAAVPPSSPPDTWGAE